MNSTKKTTFKDPEAQFKQAIAYTRTGDDEEATVWYRKAAEQGHVVCLIR